MAVHKRLLDLLVTRFPEYSRDVLYGFIMCSEVLVNGAVSRDPLTFVGTDSELSIRRKKYVSRGGYKLAAALVEWNISPAGMVWLDAGASTGGFTDVLLQAGATAVHAVDVGYNQLDYRLRTDTRVHVHERTNINDITTLDPPPAAAVCDLSFRSLRGVLMHILGLTTQGWGVALLKPQFEAAAEIRWGRRIDSGLDEGVVDPFLREELVRGAIYDLQKEGLEIVRYMDSPITGRSGNREVLLHVRRT